MSNRRIEMYQYRQVLVRMRQGESDRSIARSGLLGRHKARELREKACEQGWLDKARPLPEDSVLAEVLQPVPEPVGEEPNTGSSLEPYREEVTQWWSAGIQATTIHQALIREKGFQGSYSAVIRFVNALSEKTPAATVRLSFSPAEAAQVDFGRGPDIVDVHTGQVIKSWFFVMTLCWSRHQYAELVADQTVSTWLGCHRRAFEWFGGVVSRVIIDNAKCAITRACHRDPEVQRAYAELAEGYGFKIDPCPPREPQKKGRVEAGVKYVKRSFLPLRTFRSLTEGNRQLRDWVLEVGNRTHGSTRKPPLSQFVQIEQALLIALPAVAPELATWSRVKVHRDGHVQLDYRYYSVPYRLIGQRLWLKATEGLVSVFDAHQLVATHPRQKQPGQCSTIEDHLPPEALAYQRKDPAWCREQAQSVGPACQSVMEQLFADRVLVNLRAAQGIIALAERYGVQRLEKACERALLFDNVRYRTVKQILEKGLDQLCDIEHSFDRLAESYTGGGRFCRDPRSLLN